MGTTAILATALQCFELLRQLSYLDVRLNRQLGHYEWAGVPIKRELAEFRVTPDALLPVGTTLNAAHFVPGQFVDVQGARAVFSPWL